MSIRLDKYLCGCGAGTRSEVKKIIRNKRVSVNGSIALNADMKVSENDVVMLDGVVKEYSQFTYIMLNKPDGFISATRDRSKKTVLDLLEDKYKNIGLFPVGRLDRDTRGLATLLIAPFRRQSMFPRHILHLYLAMWMKKQQKFLIKV